MASLLEVESLVLRLYSPVKNPGVIADTQKQLQEIQKGPDGWRLAEHLMNHPDENARFFAALTFSVKLNQEGASLSAQELNGLLHKLISSCLIMLATAEKTFVLRKLCTTLVKFYALTNATWTRSIRHLHTCLVHNQLFDEEATLAMTKGTLDCSRLGERQRLFLLAFARTFAEDMTKVDPAIMQTATIHKRALSNVSDVVSLLRDAHSQRLEGEYPTDMLDCYRAWVVYTELASPTSGLSTESLSDLLIPMMDCLHDPDGIEFAAEMFTEILENSPTLMKQPHVDHLTAILNQSWVVEALGGLDEGAEVEDLALAELVLAVATTTMHVTFDADHHQDHDTVASRRRLGSMLTLVHSITRSQNSETMDEVLSNAVVGYWESLYVEREYLHNQKLVREHLLLAVEELCVCIRLEMDGDELESPNQFQAISEFRASVSSFVQSAYSELGEETLTALINVFLASSLPIDLLSAKTPVQFDRPLQASISNISLSPHQNGTASNIDWSTIEAAMFLLVGLADSLQFPLEITGERALHGFFSSSTFAHLLNLDVPAPTKARKTAVKTLGEFSDYLEEHPDQLLLTALDKLFACLSFPDYSDTAARAIYALSGKSRAVLVYQLDPFLQATRQLFENASSTETAKERTIASVAAVIEALQSDKQEQERLSTVLDLVERDYEMRLTREPDSTQQSLVTLLQLKAIGEASQTPADRPLDLDSDEERPAVPKYSSPTWHNTQAQSRIIRILQVALSSASSDSSVLQTACDVVKCGYREAESGPFVFPPQVTVDLVTSIPVDHDRADIPLLLACSFVSSHASAKDAIYVEAVSTLLQYTCAILSHLGRPSTDPEVAYQAIDLLHRCVPCRKLQLLNLGDELMATALTFSLHALESAEILPKRSAIDFWYALLAPDTSLPPAAQDHRTRLLAYYCPGLTRIAVHQIGGNASRSDLDRLSLLLKQLVKTQMPALRGWMQAALTEATFPSGRLSEAEKSRFVSMVVGLRGGKETNKVVREFWVACRGLVS
ncbi:MAG: hypothetical protein M1828_004944 [Chrysothrix sp. TS-e1954]|nr:MAG: hypothetical protein M1828_004944 [Chrysothrix sp. TS-e1954]